MKKIRHSVIIIGSFRCIRMGTALILLAVLMCFAAASAESALSGPVSEENEPEYPIVIDRSSDRNAWPDFAFPEDAEILDIWMPDIRDADATVLRFGDEVWMIDCGDVRAARRLVILLRQLGITAIDRMFNSHPHHDHIQGLEMTDDTARVKELYVCFPREGEKATEHMKYAMKVAKERGIAVFDYGDEDDFYMGNGKVTFHVWQKQDPSFTVNDLSAQMMLRYGERSMLFTADMEKPGQRKLLEEVGAEALKADILKYPHHGKLTLADEFLYAVRPELTVITNYRQYGYSYNYMKDRNFPLVYTNRDRIFLHLATDGKHWLCEYIPMKQ